METVAGWAASEALAGAPGVGRLAFGSVDFSSDSGIRDEGEALTSVRVRLVLASRLAGISAPVDGVSLALDDPAVVEADARRSRALGFGAKLCIHPKQVAAVNAAFRPTEAERAWALRVVQAVQAGGLGAISVDGKLVDKPVLMLAQAVLDAA